MVSDACGLRLRTSMAHVVVLISFSSLYSLRAGNQAANSTLTRPHESIDP